MRELVAKRRIPYIKWGHLLRFDPTDIAKWLEEAHIDTMHVATMRSQQVVQRGASTRLK